jgi:hypothetical protein
MYERKKYSKNNGQISRQKYYIKNKNGLKFPYAKVLNAETSKNKINTSYRHRKIGTY